MATPVALSRTLPTRWRSAFCIPDSACVSCAVSSLPVLLMSRDRSPWPTCSASWMALRSGPTTERVMSQAAAMPMLRQATAKPSISICVWRESSSTWPVSVRTRSAWNSARCVRVPT